MSPLLEPQPDDLAAVVEEAEQILDDVFEPRPGCCVDCDAELAAPTGGAR